MHMKINSKYLLIDKRRNESIENQLIQSILSWSQTTRYTNDSELPNITDLALQYNIDEQQIILAYEQLMKMNRVIQDGGKYYFRPFVFSTQFYSKIIAIYDQIESAGYTPSFKIIDSISSKEHKPVIDLSKYNLSSYMYTKRVFYANEIPVIVYESYLNSLLVNYEQINVEKPLYQQLREAHHIKLNYSPRQIKAVKLSDSVCDLLHLPRNSVGIKVIAENYNEKSQLIELMIGYSTTHYRIEY